MRPTSSAVFQRPDFGGAQAWIRVHAVGIVELAVDLPGSVAAHELKRTCLDHGARCERRCEVRNLDVVGYGRAGKVEPHHGSALRLFEVIGTASVGLLQVVE